MKKAFKIGSLIFLTLFLIFGAAMGIKMWVGIQDVKTLAAEYFSVPKLEDVSDGTWRGQVEWEMLAVTVDVTVRGGEIIGIDLIRHDNGLGSKAETIIRDVLTDQSLEVDVISGATLSSKAILHAIAQALNNGN